VHEAVSRATGTELTSATTRADVVDVCRHHDVAVAPTGTAGEAVVKLYEALVEPVTTAPTFTPISRWSPRLSPASTAAIPGWRSGDLVAFGNELGTAYSERIDPVDQHRHLTEQSLRAVPGDAEAMQLDEDFLRAMAYGMPPTGGLGLGVERLLMMLTGGSIRTTPTFPFVRRDRAH
jgi:lysyl-tRNA synthetase class 2